MTDKNHAPDGTTILKIPLVPFASGVLLIASGAIMAIAVDPAGVVLSLLGFAGLAYQRDVQAEYSAAKAERDQCPNCGIASDTPYRGTLYRCQNSDCEKEVFRSTRPDLPDTLPTDAYELGKLSDDEIAALREEFVDGRGGR